MAILQDVGGAWLVREKESGHWQLSLRDSYSKEIEVSFPSSGATDYEFTRKLVDTPGTVPKDVALQVLSPCELESKIEGGVDLGRSAD